MANIKKYSINSATAIIRHCERTAASHSNRQIDVTKTKDNYSLWPIERPDRLVLGQGAEGQSSAKYAQRRLRKRLEDVSCLARKDVNVLCDWVIHLGADVGDDYWDHRDFFMATVRFMCRTYGEENIIFAWVHNDEVNPHIHIGFVPVVKKKLKLRKNASEETRREYEKAVSEGKTEVERVDANSLISRRHLQKWHVNFSEYMTKELGYDPGVRTGITEALGGNMTVEDLKHKPAGWSEARRKQAEAYHRSRRAGERSLDNLLFNAERRKLPRK